MQSACTPHSNGTLYLGLFHLRTWKLRFIFVWQIHDLVWCRESFNKERRRMHWPSGLFSITTAQTHFLFKGSFYDQIDGVAMGSLLAPVLAYLFMGHHEKLWLENWQGSEVLFYRRYVEDTFSLFHSENDALLFFNEINSRDPNIRFTKE